ncbi:MAG: 50S ribosomal protein L19 [Chitinophagales bacterium]
MDAVKALEYEIRPKQEFPEFKAGDNITVNYRIKEGEKVRIQAFQGDVLQRKGTGVTQTFTVRKISNGTGVERIFPLYSPNIESIVVNKKGRVRRARIFYLRDLKGKAARIKERRPKKKESK